MEIEFFKILICVLELYIPNLIGLINNNLIALGPLKNHIYSFLSQRSESLPKKLIFHLII